MVTPETKVKRVHKKLKTGVAPFFYIVIPAQEPVIPPKGGISSVSPNNEEIPCQSHPQKCNAFLRDPTHGMTE